MAWARESKTGPIIDNSLGVLTTWDATMFKWDNLTSAYWLRLWSRGAKPSAGWVKEI